MGIQTGFGVSLRFCLHHHATKPPLEVETEVGAHYTCLAHCQAGRVASTKKESSIATI